MMHTTIYYMLCLLGGPNSCLQIIGQQSVLQLIKPLKAETHTDVRFHIVVVSHAAEIFLLINVSSTYPIQFICTLFITIPLVYLNVLVYLFFLVSCVCFHFSFLMFICIYFLTQIYHFNKGCIYCFLILQCILSQTGKQLNYIYIYIYVSSSIK